MTSLGYDTVVHVVKLTIVLVCQDVSLTQSPVKLPVSLQFRISTGQGDVNFNAELFMDRFLDKLSQELQVL